MTIRSFISSYRNCCRFLAATHHAAILNNYSRDLQVLLLTVEREVSRLEPLQYGYHNVRGRGNEPIQLVTSWRVTRIGKPVDNKLPVEEVGLLSQLIRWHEKAKK